MKKFTLCSVIVTFALCVAAVAQTSGAGGAQGTQGSSPNMGPPPSQQPGMTAPQTEQNTTTNRVEKSERKLKGCVASQGGQYVLETKKGKAVNLTGQDVSAHVGHEVALKGNWEGTGSAGMSASSSSGSTAGAGAEKTFNVTSVEHISDTCGGGKNKGTSGTMGGPGTSPSGNTPPSGTGTTPPPQ